MERNNVLYKYFKDISVHLIASEKEGIDRIAKFPRLWTNRTK